VRGEVPFHTDTRAIELSRRGATLLRLLVPATRPKVKLVRMQIDPNGAAELQWEATAEETGQRWYSVLLQLDDGRRFPLAAKITDAELRFDTKGLPGCKAGRIVVRVSDGVWTDEVHTAPFAIAPKPPIIFIFEPREGIAASASSPLLLRGQAWDVQRQAPVPSDRVTWRLDGHAAGTGNLVAVHNVKPGHHTVQLAATDEAGHAGERSVNIVVV
jgi:hypothetical protein